MHRKWNALETFNCNMTHDFKITIVRVQCRSRGFESYESDVGLFGGK